MPWEDLRYLFGEIMYGGHITDDWDRRLCRTYLEEFMNPDMLDGELYLAPGFPIPPNSDFVGYHTYIDEVCLFVCLLWGIKSTYMCNDNDSIDK